MTGEDKHKSPCRYIRATCIFNVPAIPGHAQGFDTSLDQYLVWNYSTLLAWRFAKAAKVDQVVSTRDKQSSSKLLANQSISMLTKADIFLSPKTFKLSIVSCSGVSDRP